MHLSKMHQKKKPVKPAPDTATAEQALEEEPDKRKGKRDRGYLALRSHLRKLERKRQRKKMRDEAALKLWRFGDLPGDWITVLPGRKACGNLRCTGAVYGAGQPRGPQCDPSGPVGLDARGASSF